MNDRSVRGRERKKSNRPATVDLTMCVKHPALTWTHMPLKHNAVLNPLYKNRVTWPPRSPSTYRPNCVSFFTTSGRVRGRGGRAVAV